MNYLFFLRCFKALSLNKAVKKKWVTFFLKLADLFLRFLFFLFWLSMLSRICSCSKHGKSDGWWAAKMILEALCHGTFFIFILLLSKLLLLLHRPEKEVNFALSSFEFAGQNECCIVWKCFQLGRYFVMRLKFASSFQILYIYSNFFSMSLCVEQKKKRWTGATNGCLTLWDCCLVSTVIFCNLSLFF